MIWKLSHITAALLVLLSLALPASAQETARQTTKLTSGQAAQGWQAVGRLEISAQAYCTAVLIAPNVAMTAAHCLYDPTTKQAVAPTDIVFRADLRGGRASATMTSDGYVIHPDFDYDGRTQAARVTKDLALVRLSADAPAKLAPFQPGKRPTKGSSVAIVSYGQGRDDTPVLEEGCTVLARRSGMLVLNCEVEFGSSGAPVFQRDIAGDIHVVSVISSAVDLRGTRYALGTDLERPLAKLHAMLAELPSFAGPATGQSAKALPRVRSLSATHTGGAKFVRP